MHVDFTARVIYGANLTDEIMLETEHLLSSLLVTLFIVRVMIETIRTMKKGITWSMTEMLEDLDLGDDIALMSHLHRDI